MKNLSPKSTKRDCYSLVAWVWGAGAQSDPGWRSAQGWNLYVASSTSSPCNSRGIFQLCHLPRPVDFVASRFLSTLSRPFEVNTIMPSLVRVRVSAWFQIMYQTSYTGKCLTSAE